MKIGIVTQSYHPRPGGVTENVHHTAAALAAKGHDVAVITSAVNGSVGDPPERNEIPGRTRVLRIGRNFLVPVNGAHSNLTLGRQLNRRLRHIFELERFDVLHTHNPIAPTLPLLTLIGAPAETPVVGTFHISGNRSFMLDLLRIPLGKASRRLNLRFAVSSTARDFISRYLPGPFLVLPNGVDPKRFSPKAPPIPSLRDGKFNVLFAGRFAPRKGLPYLLEAMHIASRRLDDPMRLILVGEGPGGLRRRNGRTTDGAFEVVETGYVLPEEMPSYFRSADLFCSPAVDRESFGIILLEAMAAMVPVVATSIPGYRDVIEPGRDGLLVAPRNSAALADAIVKVARHRELAQRLASKGRKKALDHSWERVVELLESHYLSLCQESPVDLPQARSFSAGRSA